MCNAESLFANSGRSGGLPEQQGDVSVGKRRECTRQDGSNVKMHGHGHGIFILATHPEASCDLFAYGHTCAELDVAKNNSM
jgi:hypothetical protein